MNKDVLEAAALSDAFNILAVLTEFPTGDVARGVASGALEGDMIALCDELGMEAGPVRAACGMLRGADADELLSQMRRSYTRLFNHPEFPAVPLYEGQYLFARSEEGKGAGAEANRTLRDARPRLFVNPASLDALREYRSAGVVPGNERAMPADAMPVEMEFCGRMHLRLSQALLDGDEERAARAREGIGEFSRLHLSRWMRGFYEDCARLAECPVYRAMGVFGTALATRLGL